MERPRVLVVEDRPAILKLLSSILDDAYDVVTAQDGAVALDLLESAVDVVLTDIRMPGISGFEVLRMALDRAPQARVIMMTGYANVPDAVAAMRLGAYDYVAKPFEADEILLVVARAVADARAHDAPVASSAAGGGAGAADPGEPSVGFHRAVADARERASREYLSSLMRAFRGNVTEAAKRAELTRESLHRVMKKYGVRSGQHHLSVVTASSSRPPGCGADCAGSGRRGVAV